MVGGFGFLVLKLFEYYEKLEAGLHMDYNSFFRFRLDVASVFEIWYVTIILLNEPIISEVLLVNVKVVCPFVSSPSAFVSHSSKSVIVLITGKALFVTVTEAVNSGQTAVAGSV